MSVRRFIVVDTSATNKRDDARYFGPNGWCQTIREAGTFTTTEAAEHEARREFIFGAPFIRIRRVRPAGTKRDAASALRTELDGLRATDAEMASRVAMAEQQASGWATAYHSASEREERVRRALGAGQDETTDDAARRVARDLAELQQAITRIIAGARS